LKKQGIVRDLLILGFTYLASYAIMWIMVGWQILYFGFVHGDWHSIPYILLLGQPILGVIISVFVGSYAVFRLEMKKGKGAK
jgi:hypothetical protein